MKKMIHHVHNWIPDLTPNIIDNFDAEEYSVLRVLAKVSMVDTEGTEQYGTNTADIVVEYKDLVGNDTKDGGYNLVTSLVVDKNSPAGIKGGVHAPVIDLDVPCELIPSTQPGHWHLYIHKEIPWDQYKNILNSLAEAGVVEPGYASASIKRGFSSVRPVSRFKAGKKQKVSYYIKRAAVLTRENYLLKVRHDRQVEYIDRLEKVIRDNNLELPDVPPIPKLKPLIVEYTNPTQLNDIIAEEPNGEALTAGPVFKNFSESELKLFTTLNSLSTSVTNISTNFATITYPINTAATTVTNFKFTDIKAF